jgi:BON domain
MNSSKRAFRLSGPAAARLSLVLSLGLTGAATLAAAPALYAQQNAARTDLAIQTDVVKALSSYPDISNEHITATVKNGVVTLHGTASSNTAKSQAQVVAATVDGVTSVINNIGVTGNASSQPDPEDPADRNEAQADQEPVQQAQSSDPNQQQAPYTPQAQPEPGSSGNWGQAGPPPDAKNGQIPQQPQGDQPEQPNSEQPNNDQADQYPMQDPGEEPGQNQAQPPQQNPTAPPPQQQSAPYPQPGYPPRPPRPPYPGQYPGQNRPYVAPNLSSTPITIRPGSLFSVRISEPLDSHKLRGGENFHATLAQDIFEGQYLVIPRGAAVQGYVVGVKKPGAVRGEAGFALQMTSLTLGGQNYPITTDTFASDTHGKGGYTTANTIGAAAIGALIGAVAGGGPGAAIGAVAGGAAGVGLSAASGPREVMPPETLLNFHLKEPLTISPISLSEVQQLQASATPRPVSRPRPPYPYPYYYGYPPPPPPPPPGYYYPYRY